MTESTWGPREPHSETGEPHSETCEVMWVRAVSADDVADETATRIEHDDVPVCLVKSDGKIHALVDRCTHQDVPLSEGEVQDGAIECFMHGSRFDLVTGAALGPPALAPATILKTQVRGNDIYVAIPQSR